MKNNIGLRVKSVLQKYIRRPFTSLLNRLRVQGKQKFFCIGMNKTGTTSLKIAFQELGIVVGDQLTAELIYADFILSDDFSEESEKLYLERIIRYCKSAQAFQDIPFSLPETYKTLDLAYPDSKFFLTVRDDAEQWYRSITRFHSKLWGDGKKIPRLEDLENAVYRRKGLPYSMMKHRFGTSDGDLYNKEVLITEYEKYINDVTDYFKDRPDDLLIVNVARKKDYFKFCDFLDCSPRGLSFPWKNKT